MEPYVTHGAGLDIHKRLIVATVLTPDPQETRSFGTMTAEVLALADWLTACGVMHVAMEATGVYWKPVVRHEAPSDREEMQGLLQWAVAAAC